MDAFVANDQNQGNKVWLNNGSGSLTDSGQSLGSRYSRGIELADLDGDGDLDAFVANYSSQGNKVWLNDGDGNFTDSGQSLGSYNSNDVKLADFDSDGDLDAYVANYNQGNRVWVNDGSGSFTDSGLDLKDGSIYESYGVDLGDVDGDGDVDAFVANYNEYNKVWLNNAYGEGQGAAAVDISGHINLTDDNTNLVGAVVKVSAGYVNGEDVLGFANTANITNAWDAATGTLTLSGSDTVANYQAALRAVTYQNTSDDPNTATRTVSFTVDDGAAVSTAIEIPVNVASINDAPEAGADSYTLVENTPLSVDGATTVDLTTVNDAR